MGGRVLYTPQLLLPLTLTWLSGQKICCRDTPGLVACGHFQLALWLRVWV